MSIITPRKTSLSFSSQDMTRAQYLNNLRVLKKNLLFCSGLPLTLTQKDIRSSQYFGQYGKINKVIMMRMSRQMTVYITYQDSNEASLAIIATDNFELDDTHRLASKYGTIKYCKYFLRCKKMPNCCYLHKRDYKNQILVDGLLPEDIFDEHYDQAIQMLKETNIEKLIQDKEYVNLETSDQILPSSWNVLQNVIKQQNPIKIDEFSSLLTQESQTSQKQNQILVETSQNYQKKSQNNQIIQLKLIRKLLRQPQSKLNNWTQKNRDKQNQFDYFHKDLHELNEMKQNLQRNITKQLNREEERLKFLMIKNITLIR